MIPLDFRTTEDPTVTIVMVTYGRRPMVERALAHLLSHTEETYELVIVDSASPDDTGAWLEANVRGARLIRSEQNIGYGAGSNLGAAQARAPLLLFLNPDVFVQTDWLGPLLEAIASTRVAAAGPQIRYPNGVLQAAGSLVFRHALTARYGDGDPNPSAPAYGYPRVADYLSGSCLLVKRHLFEKAGGFDPVFGLGYFEDVNLAFALAAMDYDSIYVPRSVVEHVRDASDGSRSLAGTYEKNHRLFQERWRDVLEKRPVLRQPGDPSAIVAARDVRAPLRILLCGAAISDALELLRYNYRLAITIAGPERHALEEHVELAQPAPSWHDWFETRRSHYDWVVGSDERFDYLIDLTQPRASRRGSCHTNDLEAAGVVLRPFRDRYLFGGGVVEIEGPFHGARELLAVDGSSQPDPGFLQSLGYELEKPPVVRPQHRKHPADPPPSWPAGDLYFVTVCSTDYLPFARTLLESIRKQHGDTPVIVTVVDAPSRDSVVLEGALVLTGREVFGRDFDYPSLKFTAEEFCSAGKQHTIDYLLRNSPADRLIYLDSDIYLFAPLDALIEKLDEADFVVLPHTVAPLPAPERFWERPSLGGIAYAGVFNAGMFALRKSDEVTKFIATAKWLSTAPGTFVPGQGGQTEQNAFNWVSCFAESFCVLRDSAYNVAYWNLHDRSFRQVEEEGGNVRWTVDGKPLVAFHFSGFTLAKPFQFSRHDTRYSLYLLPAVARVCEFYVKRLKANDRRESQMGYAFDRFPSGIRIEPFMRMIFRFHEEFLREDLDPWTPEGEAYYARALLLPIPYTGSLLPVLVSLIYDVRSDLRLFEDPSLNPDPIMEWMLSSGIYENHFEKLFDRYRPLVPVHHAAVRLSALHKRWPHLFDGLRAPLRENRRQFVARLQTVAPDEAELIRTGAMGYYISSPIRTVRNLLKHRPDVARAFADVLYEDGPAFVCWLYDRRLREHYLPLDVIDAFAQRIGGKSLARVFSYLSRTWPLMEQWPLGLLGEGSDDLARTLLRVLRHTVEYDVADVEMFLWTMELKPWAGLALTLELPVHTTRHPSSRSQAGQAEILGPLLQRDPGFAAVLDEYREQYPPADDLAPPSRRTAREVSVFASINQNRAAPPLPRPVRPGVNMFGYHRSDIGLGQQTLGLVQALDAIACPTSKIILGNVRMDDDLVPEDFIRRYDVDKGTNIFVSYPHLQDSLLRCLPDEVIDGHRNIVSLAWEQRDGTHHWKDVYAEFHQVWAVSDFAAGSLSCILEREVHSVPNVLDTYLFPPPSTKEAHHLDPEAFTFLFIFDTNSSAERKNPEAVVAAFRNAFRADDRVRLVVKASNGEGIGNRTRFRRFLDTVASDPMIEVRRDYVDRAAVYGLISAADAYVSLHHAEGFGYTCAEAMAYGKPVIATGYSGNMQFMNASNSYPVRYCEVEVNTPEGPFQRGSVWAEPDVEHAGHLMRHVYQCREEAASKGALGRDTIEKEFSPAPIGARIKPLLDEGL